MPENLSLVIITKNSEIHLGKCLASVSFASDIIVVDCGSTDNTELIAKDHGARFIYKKWDGFGLQKQFAVQVARYDWVLCLDADEWLSEKLSSKIKKILLDPSAIAYRFPRSNKFMGRFLRYGEGYPDMSLRLFHRHYARWSNDKIHEYVITDGAVENLSADLMHESGEDITCYLAKQNDYTSLQADALFEKGEKVNFIKLILSPLFRFIKFYLVRQGFRDGIPGFVHITIGCINSFLKYTKLMERWRLEK